MLLEQFGFINKFHFFVIFILILLLINFSGFSPLSMETAMKRKRNTQPIRSTKDEARNTNNIKRGNIKYIVV